MAFRVAVIVIAVVFGWTYVSRTGERDRADERRALDQRAADLIGRAVAPGSAIACLEATNTETVEGACERAVFASPETVAAATAYLSARLSLLSDAHDYTARRDQTYESAIAGLRRTVAADRYGLASQVLATRDGCTADACDAFGLVYDDKRLQANMQGPVVRRDRRALRGELADAHASARVRRERDRRSGRPERHIPVGGLDPAGQHHEAEPRRRLRHRARPRLRPRRLHRRRPNRPGVRAAPSARAARSPDGPAPLSLNPAAKQ